MRACLCIVLLMALVGCGARGPKGVAYPVEEAASDPRPRTVEVVKVWSLLDDAVTTYRDGRVSHLVEVTVLAGPPAAEAWPWDSYAKGGPPPAEGDRVVAAPAEWVGVSLRRQLPR
jgi:hypothetical protein